jgi:hypothetical protein
VIDTHPFDTFREHLDSLVERVAPGGRRSHAVIRVRHNGTILGHTRMRAVVEEACGEPTDRIKFYGLHFFLPIDGFRSSRPIHSACGTLVGVEVETDWGTVSIDAAPGLRAPSRRRTRARNMRRIR